MRPSVSEPTKRKHRGFMRAIGGLFKRRSSDASAPSDSEASRVSTSRWSRFSLRHSLPEAPPAELSAVAATPETAPIREDDTGSPARAAHPEEPPAKKAKKTKAEKPKKEKSKPPSRKGKESPSEPSQLLESSDDEYEPQRLSFLFFGGSEVDSTFVPELRPSDLDDLHENDLRPSLQAKMPLFFSPPVVENLRRSSILPDPREYEF